jgi:hypothetical protein
MTKGKTEDGEGRDGGRVDQEYRKMMTWVAIALAVSVIAALVIVEIVMRRYAP